MICERDTSLPELGAESLPTSYLDTHPYGPSSLTPTAVPYSANDSRTCTSCAGMSETWTFRHWLTLMRSAADSLVRTYQQPESKPESPASEADCSAKSCGQLTIFDLLGSSSKTPPTSEPKAGTSLSPNSWREDIPGATESLPRLTLGRHINASGGGAWQTPVADDAVERKWGKYNSRGEPKLSAQVILIGQWPTPLASDWKSHSPAKKSTKSRPLREVVAWTTPCADDTGYRTKKYQQGGTALSMQAGGPLNPAWVEWLMGWPIGHSESKHWATAKSRSARRSRGACSEAREQ